MGCITSKPEEQNKDKPDKPPLIGIHDCLKDIKCKSRCYSNCCMNGSKINTSHKHHHKKEKEVHEYNDKTDPASTRE